MNESHATLLRLLEPGVWYCASNYDGCSVLERGTPVSGKIFSTLVRDGLVDCAPVFEGFSIKKYRITAKGSESLSAM